ncbi:hypothetical protein DACRYDRAFT_105311 [Dacryopinax primogenitus]|uniref:Uncharacterized protein n=1 Tax=Dacryopinax primogenitus (strain DJM 731) TaxID=1858805 RepID=M5G7Y5_DACPD|nr:uncharacterized protein DACRYDRAFT_105311 [Dacryopinax primogenitus]EJU04245.1 hypothetical protein DACRYDRAFT_105311 [Dacryopinax primogenitus]
MLLNEVTVGKPHFEEEPAPGTQEAAELGEPKLAAVGEPLQMRLQKVLDHYCSHFTKGIPHAPTVSQEVEALLETGDATPQAENPRPMSQPQLDELQAQQPPQKGFYSTLNITMVITSIVCAEG